METVSEHLIEAEVAAPPPRRARLPISTDLLLLAALLLFVLFLCGGGRALLEAGKIGWLAATGRTVTARVQATLTEPSPAKGQPPILVGLRYVYTLPSDPEHLSRQGIVRLPSAPAGETPRLTGPPPGARQNGGAPASVPPFRVGDPLPLRCAEWLGRPLVSPWQAAPTGKAIFLALCGALVIAVTVLLLQRILRWRRHRLGLLQHGIATTGTILHKDARAEDTPRYFIRYGYEAGGEPHECEEQVSLEQWKRLEVGQPVTVLYDPVQRDDAGLYALIGGG